MQEKVLLRRAARHQLPVEIWRDRIKSPLPVPRLTLHHASIAQRLMSEIEQASPELWELLDKKVVLRLVEEFRGRLRQSGPLGGEALTSYIPLGAELQVRTAHLFAILTLLRWHSLCIQNHGKELPCSTIRQPSRRQLKDNLFLNVG
jgi:hypothetical protein